MLKIVVVAHLTYENQWSKWHTKIQTFVFLGHPSVQPRTTEVSSAVKLHIMLCTVQDVLKLHLHCRSRWCNQVVHRENNCSARIQRSSHPKCILLWCAVQVYVVQVVHREKCRIICEIRSNLTSSSSCAPQTIILHSHNRDWRSRNHHHNIQVRVVRQLRFVFVQLFPQVKGLPCQQFSSP